MGYYDYFPFDLTRCQFVTIALLARNHGDFQKTAEQLNKTVKAIRGRVWSARKRIGAPTLVEALFELQMIAIVPEKLDPDLVVDVAM